MEGPSGLHKRDESSQHDEASPQHDEASPQHNETPTEEFIESHEHEPLKSNYQYPSPSKFREDLNFVEADPEEYRVREVLARICICGKATNKMCARCKERYYCSKECQIKDMPQHRGICRPIALTDTYLDGLTTDYKELLRHEIAFTQPNWKKFFEITYTRLRDRLQGADDDQFAVIWLRIQDNIVGLIMLNQEPERLFMFITDDAERRQKPLAKFFILNKACACFATPSAPEHLRSKTYKIHLPIPSVYTFYVDWDLRAAGDASVDHGHGSDDE